MTSESHLLTVLRSIREAYPKMKLKTRNTIFFGLWTVFEDVNMTPHVISERGKAKEVETTFFGLWEIRSPYDPYRKLEGKTLVFDFTNEDGSWLTNTYFHFHARVPSLWIGAPRPLEKEAEFVGGPGSWTRRVLNERFSLSGTDVEHHGTLTPSNTIQLHSAVGMCR